MVLREDIYKIFLTYLAGTLFASLGGAAFIRPDIFTGGSPPLFLMAIFILAGVGVIMLMKIKTITIDKASRMISVSLIGLLGRSVREVQLSEIKEISLSLAPLTSRYKVGGISRGFTCNLALVLTNGERIMILNNEKSARSFWNNNLGEYERGMAVKIAGFLNVPLQEPRVPTLDEIGSVIENQIQKVREDKKSPNPQQININLGTVIRGAAWILFAFTFTGAVLIGIPIAATLPKYYGWMIFVPFFVLLVVIINRLLKIGKSLEDLTPKQ